MEVEVLDLSDINNKITQIFDNFSSVDAISEKIQKKIIEIRKILIKFQDNKTLTLNQTNSYLKLQIDLLVNEKNYYDSMRNIVLEKMSKEIFDIYDYTFMILTSLEILEIDHEEDKHNIITKIISYKKSDKIVSSNIIQLIDATVNNINLIKKFLELFNKYIEETDLQNSVNNIHCNSFLNTLQNKKNHISLEYKKYCDQLIELLEYFFDCTNAIKKQLEKEEIIKFLVEKK